MPSPPLQEFRGKNEALKNRIQVQQPRPAAELWKAAISLIRGGKGRRDLDCEDDARELLQKHHRIALHTGNTPLVADNEQCTGMLYCDMFGKSRDGGKAKKWLIDRAFELLLSADGSYVRHADLENHKECAFWLAKISFEKSLYGWSGESEVLDHCRIAEDIHHKRRHEVAGHDGTDTLEDRGLLVEIYRFAIQTCEASGDQEGATTWREKYHLAVT